MKWRGLGYSEATWESSLMPSDKVHCLYTLPLICQEARLVCLSGVLGWMLS